MNPVEVELKENAVKFLVKTANILQNSKSLKSYYLTKCRKLTVAGAVALPQKFYKATTRCPKCCMLYSDSLTTFKLESGRRKNRFARRLLKRDTEEKPLTKYQKKYLKNLQCKGEVESHNVMMITCGMCKHKIKEIMKKPIVKSPEEEEIIKPRKKKKRKDRFSGLDKNAVLSATPHSSSTFSQTKDLIPLESIIPGSNSNTESTPNKNQVNKRLFFNNKPGDKVKNKIIEKEKKKSKQKTLKGLANILNDSGKKKKPSVSLKEFLTSI